MKQEDKELLLRYLCMTLPYGVKVQHQREDYLNEIQIVEHISRQYGEIETESVLGFVDDFKPYLRPMSSMTEEEDKQRIQLGIWRSSQTNGHEVTGIKPDISQSYNSQAFQRAFNFLLKNHFDIFGLIPRDLAVEVTKENNPYNIAEK